MSPRKRPEFLAGHELQSLLNVLERKRQGALPFQIFGKKYFCAVLPSGAVAGPTTLESDSSIAQRPNSSVRVRGTVRVRTAGGGERQDESLAYGPGAYVSAKVVTTQLYSTPAFCESDNTSAATS